MKYTQNRNESGELLRIVIQKMAGHPASFHPQTYAVWYEFVAGINPALSSAMKSRLDGNEKIDDAEIAKLYEAHVSECRLDFGRLLKEDIAELIGKISGFTAETGKHASDFGDNLQSYLDKMKQHPDESVLGSLLGDMMSDTDRMSGSLRNMQLQLEESRREVDKLQQELESAKGEALVDPLTGILNRRGFEARAQQILEDAAFRDKELCLLMVDIDHFKKINDSYGHLVGDKVIRAVAEMLKSKIKGQDSVARMGGEEFAVLLPETGLKGAGVVAEHIRMGIEKGKIRRTDSQESIGNVTVSIGIASMLPGAVDMTELIGRADEALYASKAGGRNRVTVYTG